MNVYASLGDYIEMSVDTGQTEFVVGRGQFLELVRQAQHARALVNLHDGEIECLGLTFTLDRDQP